MKIFPKARKAKKRHTMAYYIIGIFTLAIELMLGINCAFLIDQSLLVVTKSMLDGTTLATFGPFIALVISLIAGGCLCLGGMWTFSGFMDSLDDAKAYMKEYAAGRWPVVLVWALEWSVIALDLTTLIFRASFFAEKGAGALLAFFVILIFLPSVLGALVHVLENTPRDRRLAKARQHAEAIETDEVTSVVETMDPDLRSRWLNGDASALQEHYDRVEAIREDNAQYERGQIEARQLAQARKNKGLPTGATIPLAPASLASQANQGSQQTQGEDQ